MKKRYAVGAVALMFVGIQADAKLWINELMQSNIDCVFAGGDFPDSWFEIYNDSDNAVRLTNYRVGDSEDFEKAFVLNRSVGVGRNGYTVIYCDKVGTGHHTDFRLDSGKGKLYLFNPQGEVVDCVSYPKMPAPNVGYGRTEDAGDEWGYELTPTPRAANGGGVTATVLPEPVFSVKGNARYNVKKIEEVTISIPEGVDLPADTRLYVTTDAPSRHLTLRVMTGSTPRARRSRWCSVPNLYRRRQYRPAPRRIPISITRARWIFLSYR